MIAEKTTRELNAEELNLGTALRLVEQAGQLLALAARCTPEERFDAIRTEFGHAAFHNGALQTALQLQLDKATTRTKKSPQGESVFLFN